MPSALGHSLRGPGSPTKTHRQCNLTKTQSRKARNINLNYLARCSLPFIVLNPLPLAPLLDSLHFPGREKHKWALCHLAQSLGQCLLLRAMQRKRAGQAVSHPAASAILVVAEAMLVQAPKGSNGWSWQIQEAAWQQQLYPRHWHTTLAKNIGSTSHHTDLGSSRSHGDFGEAQPMKEMANHSSILAWKIPRSEEPGGLQSMGWQRVSHNWGPSTGMVMMHIWDSGGTAATLGISQGHNEKQQE